MDRNKLYQDIAKRTQGDIYIGVVGPVRTGKSTFIKRFMDSLVIPNIEDASKKEKELTGIIKDLARGDKEAPTEKTELDRVIDEINAFKAHNKYF